MPMGDLGEVANQLESASVFVAEPLLAHLHDGVDDGRLFGYEIEGAERRSGSNTGCVK